MFSDQSSVLFYYFLVNQNKVRQRPVEKQLRLFMAEMVKTKVTSQAKHPERTQNFITSVKEALDAFEEQISFPEEEVRGKAYKILLHAYKEALEPVWNLARFADVGIILKTISDKEMLKLCTMAKQLQPAPTTSKVTKETRPIPGLESILDALKDKRPSESLPNTKTCEKISEVFTKIHCAHKAFAETAEGLAELSTEVTPQQYTMLLTAAAMPTIQIIVPGQLVSPFTAPPPPQPPASTALGRSEIIKYTKLKVLPNPDATALTACDENSATRVLAAAVYCKLEQLFFDDKLSRADIATAFRCNISQLTKAVTGVDYKGGPHKYKPKKPTKRTMQTTDKQAGPSKRKATPSSSTQPESTQATDPDEQEDTLPSSSDSDLPLSLLN